MRLISPTTDFDRTLAALPDTLARLLYLSSRCDKAGRYSHWGLARSHGEDVADKVMRDAHESTFLQCLATPLRDLEGQMTSDRSEAAIEGLRAPRDVGGASTTHLNSIKEALFELTQSPEAFRLGA